LGKFCHAAVLSERRPTAAGPLSSQQRPAKGSLKSNLRRPWKAARATRPCRPFVVDHFECSPPGKPSPMP
jgi:hypothetical protein